MAKIQCKAKTSTGAECRAPAGLSGFCFFHANPDKAHSLGQIGGRKNRAQMPDPPAAGSLSAGDLHDILAGAIRDVLSKKITHVLVVHWRSCAILRTVSFRLPIWKQPWKMDAVSCREPHLQAVASLVSMKTLNELT